MTEEGAGERVACALIYGRRDADVCVMYAGVSNNRECRGQMGRRLWAAGPPDEWPRACVGLLSGLAPVTGDGRVVVLTSHKG